MTILGLVELVPQFKQIIGDLHNEDGRHGVIGLNRSACAFLIAAICERLARPCLIISHTTEHAELIANDLEAWFDRSVNRFYPRDLTTQEVLAQSRETTGARISSLVSLVTNSAPVVVTTGSALVAPVISSQVLRESLFIIKQGMTLDVERFLNRLLCMGYEHTPKVDAKGKFARRGGIIDIWGLDTSAGLRMELFGDVVDSLRLFDPGTQRTLTETTKFTLKPVSELIFLQTADRNLLISQIQTELADLSKTGGITSDTRRRYEELCNRLELWETVGLESLIPCVNPSSSVMDYLPDNAIVTMLSPRRVENDVCSTVQDFTQRFKQMSQDNRVIAGQGQIITAEALRGQVQSIPGVDLYGLDESSAWSRPRTLHRVACRPVPSFFGKWDMFIHELRRWSEQKIRVVVFVSSLDRANHLAGALLRENIHASAGQVALEPGHVHIVEGEASVGFHLPDVSTILISEQDIFGHTRRRKAVFRKIDKSRAITSYLELKPGDLVVHVNHGIGRYLGLRTLEIEDSLRDYLFLKYAGEDRLYVPTDQVQLVQKYIGGEGAGVKLNRLGGSEWKRVRGKVKSSVRQMARELLELYAKREALTGTPSGDDTPWQREFEESFPYQETPDQIRAIDEIKADLETHRPMERLLCGDVGYGKTEVALRAAFKVILSGKQVAVLVPTTVLAHQHFLTCKERFAQFPVTVEMLSRFRSPGEQRTILQRTASGKVDLVIGTHRLLQQDVVFKNLGLIIVDEEHRFGVSHKEKLKQLYPSVDVLILTATPIPRTLHMSLTGLRDISLMETPPEDRYPIQTYVTEYDEGMVVEAIRRELARQGQVYYVYNRVDTMDFAFRRLSRAVPEARIGVVHGQMSESRLERVMVDFLDGGYDVLLCTTIIESGLDIPNVNTLIVEDSDRLGLAQLYQLRGRVGRSNRLAFAYFTYRRERILSEIAEKRLTAIREFTELGSGFKLALRDLEIRGAGNLLGAEQHGFIVAVGFDMYCRLLEEAVRELKGEPQRQDAPVVTLEFTANAYLPDDYVPHAEQKMDMYQRLALIHDRAGVDSLHMELIDRFGPLPEAAKNLLVMALIRIAAGTLGITRISVRKGVIRFQFLQDATLDLGKVHAWAVDSPYRVRISKSAPPMIRITTGNKEVTPTQVGAIIEAWQDGSAGE